MQNYKGTFVLLIGPSGSGKGTLGRFVKKNFPQFQFPISCTTRAMRDREKEGQNYYFISKDEFRSRIDQNKFLEWAQVHNDNYYGTLNSEVLPYLEQGTTVFRELDVQGVDSLLTIFPRQNLKLIFVTAKNWQELEKRITGRSTISKEEVEARRQSFLKESEYANICDHVIINEDGKINRAKWELAQILRKI